MDEGRMTDSIGTPEDVMVSGREMLPEDLAFVYSTWRNGIYYGSLNRDKFPPADQFFREQTERIKNILAHAHVRMACIKDAPDVILGYAVFTGDLHLEWIFIKPQFRAKGIANFITVKTKTVSPPVTKSAAAIVEKKNLTVKGIPYEQI